MKEDVTTKSSNFEIENLGGSILQTVPLPGSQIIFTGYTDQQVIDLINQYIKGLNSGWVNFPNLNFSYPAGGVGRFTNQFPFFFGPNPSTYQLRKSDNPVIFSNFTDIFENVKFNPVSNYAGYGIMWNKDTVGPQTTETTEEIEKIKYLQSPVTYGVMGGDFLYLLSHNSQKPSSNKIDLKDTLYGIGQEEFVNTIKPNTSSMVRGEELIDLLEKIVTFLTTHTHPFPGLPPIQEPAGTITVTQLDTLINNAQNTILNQNIRIN